jgi:hypothetical protein
MKIDSNQRCSVLDCPSETAPRYCVPEKGGSQQQRQVQPTFTSCIVHTGSLPGSGPTESWMPLYTDAVERLRLVARRVQARLSRIEPR